MKVQYRLLIITALLGSILMAGFVLLQWNQHNQITEITQTRHTELEPLFKKILELENSGLSTIVLDYTYWDEMVSFVRTADPDWAKNILENSLDSYQIHAIWVFSPELEQVYTTASLPGLTSAAFPLNAAQIKSAFQQGPTTSFCYRLSDGTLIEIHGSIIVPSNDIEHKTPAKGYFFAGRAWTPARLAHLAELTGAQVEIVPTEAYSATQTNTNFLDVSAPEYSFDGKLIAYIRGNFPNGYIQGFSQAQSRDLGQYLALTALLILILGSGLGLWIAAPLGRISNSLTRGELAPITPLFSDGSEFGRIAQLIRLFFNQRSAMAEQIEKLTVTEHALRESEQRYRTISEITSDATYSLLVAEDGKITSAWDTDAVRRISGWSITDLIEANRLSDIIHPEDRKIVQAWKGKLLAGTKLVSEIRLTTQGEIRWVRNHMTPIRDEVTGQIIRIYGAAQDITVQRNAEEAYRTLVNHSLQGLVILQGWALRFVNPALTRMVGRSAEELLALTEDELSALFDPESVAVATKSIPGLMAAQQETTRFLLRVRHSDSSWRWLDVNCELIEYQGRPAVQGSCVDVTEHILAEQALQEQTEYSNILFSTVNSLVLVITPEGKITTCNPAAQEMLQLPVSSPAPLHLWEIFTIPDQAQISQIHFNRTVQTQTTVDGIDLYFNGPNGPRWLSWSQRYKTDPDGSPVYVIGTAIDITERKTREHQQETLAAIAVALRGGATRSETIQTMLKEIRSFANVDSVAVAFPVAEKDDILIEFTDGFLKPLTEGRHIGTQNSITGSIFRSGKPYISKNIAAEPELAIPEVIALVRSAGWIPLISETRTIGVLMIASKGEITEGELNLLLPIADMAAGAIDRAERTEQAQRQVKQLSALQSINLAIGASLDLRVTLNVLAVQMTSQLGVDAVDILLLNSQTNRLRYAAGNGFRSREVEKLRLWLGEGQAGRAAMERRSRHLFDPDGIASYFIPADLFTQEDFVAYDAVPLVVKGEVKGVIEAYHRAPYNQGGEWQQLLEALALETAIAIDNAELLEQLQRSKQDLEIAFDATLEGLADMLELYDFETKNHSSRVVDLTVKLAQYLGVSGTSLTHIRRGAYMHDIGKIGIPLSIINKPGKLDPDEWKFIRQHPQNAHKIMAPIPFLAPALDIPYGHHERWDGSGYPQGQAGEEIPLAARIFAVVDIFDALTNQRSYREPWTEEKALDYIRSTSGREVDPRVANAFLELYPMLPKKEV